MEWFRGSPEELNQAIENYDLAAFYVSTENCSVCNSLKPKVASFFADNFPKVHLNMLRSELYPRWSSKYSIFSAPVLLIFADGKEIARYGRNLSFEEIEKKLKRIQELLEL